MEYYKKVFPDKKMKRATRKYRSENRTLTSYIAIPSDTLDYLIVSVSYKLLFACCKLH
jgi:hypothetical protein